MGKLLTIVSVLTLLLVGAKAESATTIMANAPPFALTLSQLEQWTAESGLASEENVAQQKLARRMPAYLNPNLSAKEQTDNRAAVLYAPDGMNNFGNYLTRQPTFNLYNFTHWADIDVLNWFAGTAEHTIQIPARPWVDAAHKNGVKVIGSVFLGVSRWGGSADTVETLLRQDADGHFVMADQLLEIAQYYGFDGWLINQETDLTAVKDEHNNLIENKKDRIRGQALAKKMRAFVQYLTANAPVGMEIHWYDSMVGSGEVKWQNTLNDENSHYLQDGIVRTSDAIFLNYWWNEAMVDKSVAKATAIRRSPYDVYTGADLWPQRNAQAAFREFEWYQWLFDGNRAKTSLAIFAPNFNYNFAGDEKRDNFSDFDRDSSDVERFYTTEQRLFVGDDLNLAEYDHSGWPGLASKLAATTPHLSLPFNTTFNTGHGRAWFEKGEPMEGDWTDISEQSPLPTWQFAVFQPQKNNPFSVNYWFDDAYEGGSSLRLQGIARGERIPLFATAFVLTENSALSLVSKGKLSGLAVYIQDSEGKRWTFELQTSTDWETHAFALDELNGTQVVHIGFVASQKGEGIEGLIGALTVTP